MFFNDRVTHWGMMTATWFLILLTLPFFYVSCKEASHGLTKCGIACYPNTVMKETKRSCICEPIIKDKRDDQSKTILFDR